jgi:hypothetical protein
MDFNAEITELKRQLAKLEDAVKAAEAKEAEADNRPITERVKTFEDAVKILGTEHPFVCQYDAAILGDEDIDESDRDTADLVAYYKLRIITAALNEGWEPKFTEDEWRYYPWFTLYTQEEWNGLSEAEKERGVLFGGYAYNGALAGFVYAYSTYAPSFANAYIGSRLCFRTEALAVYAGRQFAALYADFYLIRK